jgi:peptidyl-prolyl cis-trans isomerase B (cyclophilin B)
MARTSDPDSATSQFFICDGAQHGLDENYAAFGVVLVGFNTLDDISQVETTRKHFMDDWPVDEVVIQDVIIS